MTDYVVIAWEVTIVSRITVQELRDPNEPRDYYNTSLVPGALTFCGGAWRARERNARGTYKISTRNVARAPRTAAERQSAGDEAVIILNTVTGSK